MSPTLADILRGRARIAPVATGAPLVPAPDARAAAGRPVWLKLANMQPLGAIVTGRNLDMARFARIVGGKDVRLGAISAKGQSHGA
ncbi:hypothetical protein [Actibacterium sp. MT2.3-13A]|uniref:hypothetical protein n=1 Tax=Actibacterium sp. MT2.3-13A TaxID=2828332 RepID=UPI001BAB7F47|nr:hypothetical protein [Actibacterium sp. MT2.3-13A]